jgi:hypothetical protein
MQAILDGEEIKSREWLEDGWATRKSAVLLNRRFSHPPRQAASHEASWRAPIFSRTIADVADGAFTRLHLQTISKLAGGFKKRSSLAGVIAALILTSSVRLCDASCETFWNTLDARPWTHSTTLRGRIT